MHACVVGMLIQTIGAHDTTTWAGETQLHLCSWPTFFYYWETKYPKLRVRKPVEDICSFYISKYSQVCKYQEPQQQQQQYMREEEQR
jgi:hypothetical protein